MYTQCPHCLTAFDVDAALLAHARGRLCCGACGREFDGLARIAETPAALGRDSHAVGAPPRIQPCADPAQIDMFGHHRPPPHEETDVPRFVRQRPVATPRTTGNGRWWVLALLLSVSLAGQIIFAERAKLATDPLWRAWLEPVCLQLRCTLPPWRDSSDMNLAARSISPHPAVKDALMVTATLQNDARWAQAWPLLELTLSDLDGNPIAKRRFTAEEYLGGPPSQPTLSPGQTAVAQLEIADPGKTAVAFAFEFY